MTYQKPFDSDTKPPRLGWQLRIGKEHFQGHSETQVFEKIKRWRQQNGTFVGDADIHREMWAIYCERMPERCGATKQEADEVRSNRLVRREITKDFAGPIIWRFLNIAAAQFTPGTIQGFVGILGHITHLIGCPVCQGEWQRILAELGDPGLIFTSRYAVCQWVNATHNRVNIRAGKAHYPYESMVREYGAPAFEGDNP